VFRVIAAALYVASVSGCHDDRASGGSGTSNSPAGAITPSSATASASSVSATPPAPATPSAAPLPRASAPISSASARASSEPGSETDFEDEFEYGSADPSLTAHGTADPRALDGDVGYESYGNGRFGFALDVPRAFRAMPEPTNGDGLQWRLGGDAVLTASGMYAMGDSPFVCARSKNVTAHSETKRTCWSTGKRDGFIYWERARLERGVIYLLRFQYRESLKDRMAPIVEHVNASWKI
jgi:hypothetical protein